MSKDKQVEAHNPEYWPYGEWPGIQLSDCVDVPGLVREMVNSSGKSAAQVSREIQRSDGFLASMLHRGSMPSVDLFADIAAACGYSVIIRSERDEFVMLPTHSTGEYEHFKPVYLREVPAHSRARYVMAHLSDIIDDLKRLYKSDGIAGIRHYAIGIRPQK